jgi:hypothetical protein
LSIPGSCYVSTMVRKVDWSRRLPHSITPLDGERMVTLRDVQHHNNRDRILLTNAIESARIDKQVVNHLNPYG